ncbi:SinI family restriction endonuclease [Elizabethkingia anophelis]|nr:SinI family restriction endonuclease [Elizabethkingia anophelis]MCT4233319.1 SinI family restriction endonuclease [Elizabethkingia anophelis]
MSEKPFTFNEDIKKSLSYLEVYKDEECYDDLKAVLSVAIKDVRNLPSLRMKGEVSVEDYTKKYAEKYIQAYNNRPSLRKGKPAATYPDPVQKMVLDKGSFKKLSADKVDDVIKGHSFLMSLENIIGDLLEEYLSEKLKPLGWYCCWGSSIDAVDFCKINGELLQVKNSDNSENSSSSRVRNGTEIKKWYRRFSKKENFFNWEALISLTGAKDVNERDFRKFITDTLDKNPDLIFREK